MWHIVTQILHKFEAEYKHGSGQERCIETTRP
jgi:hypothetical protein